MPDVLLPAATYLFSHDSYLQGHQLAQRLRQTIDERELATISTLVPPDLAEFTAFMAEANVPICKDSLDAELAAGTIDKSLHANCLKTMLVQEPEEHKNRPSQLPLFAVAESVAIHMLRGGP